MRSIEQLMAEGRKRAPPRSRKPRPSRVFTAEGEEVFITLTCPHCHGTKPLSQFGLCRMQDGTIRSCPWCKACRSKPSVPVRLVTGAP